MGKSHTRKRSKYHHDKNVSNTEIKTIQELDVGLKQVVTMLHHWTTTNFKNIQKTKKQPLCWVSDNSALVGNIKLTKIGQYCWRAEDDAIIHDFTSKNIALYYSILSQSGYAGLANEIKDCDRDIGRFEDNITYYNRAMNRAIAASDGFSSQMWGMRLDNTVINMNQSKETMKLLIKRAKYIIVRRDFTK